MGREIFFSKIRVTDQFGLRTAALAPKIVVKSNGFKGLAYYYTKTGYITKCWSFFTVGCYLEVVVNQGRVQGQVHGWPKPQVLGAKALDFINFFHYTH